MKQILCGVQTSWNQVCRYSSWFDRASLWPRVGSGLEMKTDFPKLIRRLKSLMKSTFVSSDGVLMVSFVPQWRVQIPGDREAFLGCQLWWHQGSND